MPTFYDYIAQAEQRADNLRQQRGEDYNNKQAEIPDYFPLGWASYFQMCFVKVKRIESLIGKVENGESPECLLDSILDGINYHLFMAAAVLRELDKIKQHQQQTRTAESDSCEFNPEEKKKFRENLRNFCAINSGEFNLSKREHEEYRNMLQEINKKGIEFVEVPVAFQENGLNIPNIKYRLYLTPSEVLLQEILDLDNVPVFVNRYYKSQLEEGKDLQQECIKAFSKGYNKE